MIRRSLLRIRLETDRLLRARPLIARALAGYLERPAYADLVTWVGELVPGDLRQLAAADLAELGLERRAPGPEAITHLYRRALGRARRRQELGGAAALVALGTSWTSEAAESLGARFFGATQLFEELAARGPDALDALPQRAASDEALALVELARGALLGVVSQLELAWPAPTSSAEAWAAARDAQQIFFPNRLVHSETAPSRLQLLKDRS